MSFNYFKVITAAALLVIPGASFANANEIVIDDNGDLRITLAGGDSRALRFSPADPVFPDDDGLELLPFTGSFDDPLELLPFTGSVFFGDPSDFPGTGGSTFNVSLTVDGSLTIVETYFDFSGDIYIEANEDDGRDFVNFEDFNLEGTVNILSGRGDDQIQFSGMDVGGGLDVRARQGDDFHRIDTSTFRGPVVLRGFSGRDDFQIFGSSFLDDLRVRGGRDLDLFSISESAFTGDVTRFNGREGFDQINHGRNFPSLTSDNFRNMDIVVNLDTD